ncbi:MAG: putative toxin-antitoxin system toxin component, PIN family [Thermoflexales bacterium]|nr:putative toxin-antitoxin system toxin component, PIN family [Thermoflexales bacterium]
MERKRIVLDTSVLVAALRSRRGASHRLLSLLGDERFEVSISVPLLLEYEAAAKRLLGIVPLTEEDIEAVLDYICAVARRWKLHYLWRPVLRDPKDEMVLELAVTANCEYIVTHNIRDFEGAEQFGIRVVTPKEFLREIGEVV